MKEYRDSLITTCFILLFLSSLCISVSPNNTPGNVTKDIVAEQSIVPLIDSFTSSDTYSSPLYGGISFDITMEDGYLDGYNLFNLHAINASRRGQRINNSLVIFDMEGNLLLENSVFNKPIELINSTTVLGDSSSGAVLWNMETDVYQFLGFRGHHEYEYNPNDNTIFTLELTTEEIGGAIYRFDKIQEYALDGTLVWSLDVHDFIDYTQWCPYHDRQSGFNDVTHCNTVFYDADEDTILLNGRNVNTFYKIDHSTGDVIWALGEYGDFTLIDRFGRQKTSLFYHAHSVEQIDDNRYIIFDNDFHNQTDNGNHRSRILEIEIDENTMTATEAWSWTGDLSYYSAWWGDADRLANGNRLGTFGTETKDVGPYGARLVEVNEDGDIVWEMSFENTEEFIYGVYRMERIRFSPLLSSPPDVLVSYGSSLDLSWQTWYNFRSKRTMYGTYELYIDDFLSDNGPVEFDKFWRATNLNFGFSGLSVGDHNITLLVKDEGGHGTSDTVNVSVRTFHIDRTGPLIIETSVSNSIITWSGVSSYSVSYELSVNGTVIGQDIWDKSDIHLDLNTLSIGHYNIILEFTNTTGIVYSDSFWVIVNPSAIPVFTSVPDDTSIDWNTTTTMSWSVFDHSPSEWYLYRNGTIILSGTWNGGTHNIDWHVSGVDEGLYNITMILRDVVSNTNSSTCWLYVIPPSPPILTKAPYSDTIEWAKSTVRYNWEVHGGTHWMLYRNGTIMKEGTKRAPQLTLEIINWQADGWRLGDYNITLVVSDELYSISSTIWLTVYVDFGDAYVDAVVTTRSAWYSDGDNAVGAPDGEVASLFEDYGPGYMTLDMGENEEIFDEEGTDFEVIANGGNYSISVSPDLIQPFLDLGVVSGNHSFELSSIEYNKVRYVKLEIYSSETVFLDAIVALNYNEQGSDNDAPIINQLNDLEIWTNQTPYEIEWTVSDRTPWNYSIYLNGTLSYTAPWDGSPIVYSFDPPSPGVWEVHLVVVDLFDNTATNTLLITLHQVPGIEPWVLLAIGSGVVGVIALTAYLFHRKKSGSDSGIPVGED